MSIDHNISLEKNQESKKILKAIAQEPLKIGNFTIDCAVLSDGTQVITRPSIHKLMGKSNHGGRPTKKIQEMKTANVQIPSFLSANNLNAFIPNTLSTTCTPITFIGLRGGRYQGYIANIIPDICDTYLDARKACVLTKDQIPIASTLEIISRALTRVGIAGLINEACGIVTSEKDYLQKILNTYIDKVLQPWVKRFPKTFFERYKKMYGIENNKSIPMHIGNFINNTTKSISLK